MSQDTKLSVEFIGSLRGRNLLYTL
jgi:hypothetical protein